MGMLMWPTWQKLKEFSLKKKKSNFYLTNISTTPTN